MSSKSEAYKKDLGNSDYRNSEYWIEREKAEQRRNELKRKLKALKTQKQVIDQDEPKNDAQNMPKFCDTGLGA